RLTTLPPQCARPRLVTSFFFQPPSPTALYTLSLHDALPIYGGRHCCQPPLRRAKDLPVFVTWSTLTFRPSLTRSRSWQILRSAQDRKSTRLNSSHRTISYAVFCLIKKI